MILRFTAHVAGRRMMPAGFPPPPANDQKLDDFRFLAHGARGAWCFCGMPHPYAVALRRLRKVDS